MKRMTVVTSPGDALERPVIGGASSVLLVRAAADLDAASEPVVRRELRTACAAGGAGWVLLYLGEQVFVGVRGLAVLLEASAWARASGRGLLVVAPPPSLQRMVEVLDLGRRLRCVPSAWEAAAVIGSDDRANGAEGPGRHAD